MLSAPQLACSKLDGGGSMGICVPVQARVVLGSRLGRSSHVSYMPLLLLHQVVPTNPSWGPEYVSVPPPTRM